MSVDSLLEIVGQAADRTPSGSPAIQMDADVSTTLEGVSSPLLPFQISGLIILSIVSVGLWYREWLARRRGDSMSLLLPATKSVGAIGLLDLMLFVMVSAVAMDFVKQISGGDLPRQNLLITMAQLLTCGISLLTLGWRYPRVRRWFIVPIASWRFDVRRGVAGVVLVLPAVMVLHATLSLLFPYRHGTLESMSQNTSWQGLLSQWLVTVIATAVFEEYLFRGLVLSWLVACFPPDLFGQRRGWLRVLIGDPPSGPAQDRNTLLVQESAASPGAIPFAAIGSAVLFGMAHLGQGSAPVALTIFALFQGWLFLKTHSLWACVISHALFNAWSLAWFTAGLLQKA